MSFTTSGLFLILCASLMTLQGCRQVFPFPAGAASKDSAVLDDVHAPWRDIGVSSESALKDMRPALDSEISCTSNGQCARPASGCCGGYCVDLLSDPRNCGRCERDCGGEADSCQEGQCTPVLLNEDSSVTAIALQDGQIYLTRPVDSSPLWRIDVDTEVAEQLPVGAIADARGIAVDSTHIYWVGGEGVARRSMDPGDPSVEQVSDTTGFKIFLNSTAVLWTSGTKLYRLDKNQIPGVPGDVADVTGYHMALDDSAVYYRQMDSYTATIYKHLLDGPAGVLASGQDLAGGLARHQDELHWANYSSGRLFSVDLTGDQQPVPHVDSFEQPLLIVVDQTHLFISSKGHQLQRISRSGGEPDIIYQGEEDDVIRDLHMEDEHLVWLVFKKTKLTHEIWKWVK